MDRRLFLTSVGLWGLSQSLVGCQSSPGSKLNVHALKGSVPPQLVRRFRGQAQAAALELVPQTQLSTLFTQLQTWKLQSKSGASGGLVTLGDYWLAKAIQQGLIQPLEPTQLAHWEQLPEIWQSLVRRDRSGLPDQAQTKSQKIWGAPYRWGMTVIAYRKDKFKQLGWTPKDWRDLWRPELERHLSLLNQPREVIGLTLKKLGHSYNTQDLEAVAELQAALQTLNRQAKLYSSNAYLQPLVLGDTWLAVGWSSDILPIARRNNQIQVVIPESGTALWADVWVQSASALPASLQTLSNNWIDFWWQPQIAKQLTQLSSGLSPLVTGSNLSSSSALSFDQATFKRSEFLQPLPAASTEQYQKLWSAIRSTR